MKDPFSVILFSVLLAMNLIIRDIRVGMLSWWAIVVPSQVLWAMLLDMRRREIALVKIEAELMEALTS